MKDKKFAALLGIGGVMIIVAVANYLNQKDSMTTTNSIKEEPLDNRSMSSVSDQSVPPNHEQMIEIQKLRDHLKSNPNATDHWIQLGNLLFDAGRFDEALEPYKTALDQMPENNDVRTDYAVSFFNVGRSQEAIKELERVVQSDPRHITALYNLGVIYLHTDQKESAKKYWNELIVIAPGSDMANKARQQLQNVK